MRVINKTAPLIFFLIISVLLYCSLSLHPTFIPSPLINKPAPAFELPDLLNPSKTVTNKDFLGHVTLLNVWATWCAACATEQPFLLRLAKQAHIIFYGLDYKDNPADAKKWLKIYGNPYQRIAEDQAGNVAIDWGVYGTPETYIIDKKGIVRYKHIAGITHNVWQTELQPLVDKLNSEDI
jgi:cytochrome c biogenesis protein CcmG/thiol:disulfide interchange protein DsbE